MSAHKTPVNTGLFSSKAPLEWAVISKTPHTLYTAQIPIDDQGNVVPGGIEAQTRQTLENLKQTLEAANEGLDAVLQVNIFVTKREHLAPFNKIYAEYFTSPFPNRAALIVSGFAREEMLVEITVTAAVRKI